MTPLAAARELLQRPRTRRQTHLEAEHAFPGQLYEYSNYINGHYIDNGPALNAMLDRYLTAYWSRARVCVFGRWATTASARHVVAGTAHFSRRIASFLVGDVDSIRA